MAESGFHCALAEARQLYEQGMEAECGPHQPSVPTGDIKHLHNKHVSNACQVLTCKKTSIPKEEIDKQVEKLADELQLRLPKFVASNATKIKATIEKAKDVYDNELKRVTKNKALCVHPLDLEEFHAAALEAAMEIFDGARKKISADSPDDERTQFKQNIHSRYMTQRLSNEHNNKMLVWSLRKEYWQYMQPKVALTSALSDSQLEEEHKKALGEALDHFNSKRNFPNTYSQDEYKNNLLSGINDSFALLKKVNKSLNKEAILAAVDQYDDYMKDVVSEKKCSHPYQLVRLNAWITYGVYHALHERALSPQALRAAGVTSSVEDADTLTEILRQRYEDFKSVNDSFNKIAVQEAYYAYVSIIDHLPTPWWFFTPFASLSVGNEAMTALKKNRQIYEEAKNSAEEVFYSKRHDVGYKYYDNYKDLLDKMIDSHFKGKFTE